MRTLVKVSMPVEASNKAIKDGSLPKIIQSFTEDYRPESSYFYADNGKRTALFVFDLKDSTQIPQVAELFFMGLNAAVDFFPVMNASDLKTGLEKAFSKKAGRIPVAA